MSSCIVTVNKITSLEPIQGADRIELAKVLDWYCIVQKGTYVVGQTVLYVPPDSILPQNIVDQFKLTFLKKGNRVGVLKLKKTISYGLILDNFGNWREGQEVSKELGITKYEAPDVYEANPTSGMRKTSRKKLNPNFFKYCDIENAKNYPDLFSTDDEIVITEKIHGANFRCGWLKRKNTNWFDALWGKLFGEYEFVYGSRTVQISSNNNYKGFYGEDVYGRAAEKNEMKRWCQLYPDYEFFGEVYGPKIQDLTYDKKEIDLIFFDIKDTKTERYLNVDEFNDIMYKLFLPAVPILYRGKFNKDLVLKFATGTSALAPKQIKEGVVVKTVVEKPSKIGRTLAKFINPSYYTRENGTENK